MRSWIAHAQESLIARRPRHEATLAALRKAALPYGDAERRREHAESYELLAQLEARRSRQLEAEAEDASEASASQRLEDELSENLK